MHIHKHFLFNLVHTLSKFWFYLNLNYHELERTMATYKFNLCFKSWEFRMSYFFSESAYWSKNSLFTFAVIFYRNLMSFNRISLFSLLILQIEHSFVKCFLVYPLQTMPNKSYMNPIPLSISDRGTIHIMLNVWSDQIWTSTNYPIRDRLFS